MSRRASACGLLLGAVGLCLLTGCGEQGGPVRHEVTGTVTFKKEPLNQGIIDFHPLDGQGSKSGAGIENGAYQIPKDKGLFPGRYRAEIFGGDGIDGSGDASPDVRTIKPGQRPGVERIPPAYNAKSKLIIEVTSNGANNFSFEIP